jgi:hypothetical protein
VQRISQLDDPPHFPSFGLNQNPGRARRDGAGSAQERKRGARCCFSIEAAATSRLVEPDTQVG